MLAHDLTILKEEKGLTAKEIAEASGVPLATVNRILSGQTPDPGYSTVSKLLIILDPDGSHINKRFSKSIDFDLLKEMIAFYENELKQLNKWIKILFGILLAITAIILILLIIDILFIK